MFLRLGLLSVVLALAAGLPHVPKFQRTLPRLPKIVGGVTTDPNEFPHQISMQKSGIFGKSHSCGGSIIDVNNVLTAAHCISGQDPTKIFVVAGEHVLNVNSGLEQEHSTSSLVVHSGYNSNTNVNDIGLIKVSSPFVLSSVVQTIAMPALMEIIPVGTMCTTTGWGTTSEGGSISQTLRKVDVPVVSDDDCRVSYGVSEITDDMLCAGYPAGGKDACQGDSGGPFVCNGKLHGLTSWGYGCARPDFPGIYTEVAYFRDWVDANV